MFNTQIFVESHKKIKEPLNTRLNMQLKFSSFSSFELKTLIDLL